MVRFFIENPKRGEGGVSRERGEGWSGREGVCGEFVGGGGVNISFRGRNSRLEKVQFAPQILQVRICKFSGANWTFSGAQLGLMKSRFPFCLSCFPSPKN